MRNNHLLLKKQSFPAATGGLAGPWSNRTHSNRICWLVPVSDWVDSLIGPSGLLLVVFHLLGLPVLWVGLEKKKVSK
jgi:hypothetical protein